jgi:hypothetical protein
VSEPCKAVPLTIPEYTAFGLIALDDTMVRRIVRAQVGPAVPEAEVVRIAYDTCCALAVAVRGRHGNYQLVGTSIADEHAMIIHAALAELKKEMKEAADGFALPVDFDKLHGKLAEVIEDELAPCIVCGEPLPEGVDCDHRGQKEEDP